MFFRSKQKAIETLIARYLERIGHCLDCFNACLEAKLSGQPFDEVVERAIATEQAESRADDTRKEICILLYGKALFPESRGDILGLIEAADRLPNAAESVVRQIRHERTEIPAELANDFRELATRATACARELVKALGMLFEDYNTATHLADRVDDLESRVDDTEYALIEKIFRSGLDSGERILLRDLARRISDIADRAENAGDRVRIAAIKRKV